MNSIASLEVQAGQLPQMDDGDIAELAARVEANAARLADLRDRIAAEQRLRERIQTAQLWRVV